MVQHLKQELRKRMLKARDALTEGEVMLASQAISYSLAANERFIEARTIGFYIRKGNEVDTRPMIDAALRAGKHVCAPVTSTHSLEFHFFESLSDMKPGKFGILEPKTQNTKPGETAEPDLIVVPGVAFGLCMHRLGYGKGYYDRFLAKSAAYRVGVCFDFQVMEKLPSHEDDQRMDEIITEKRVITL